MSWHFSQALVAEYSEGGCSDGGRCARSSESLPPSGCCSPGKTTDALSPSRSGTMSAPSTESPGVEWWISSLEASRVRTSPPPEKAKASVESAADSGKKWHGSFAKWDHDSCSWKTHQFSLLGGLESFSETWPRWGMMRDGACWEQSIPAHLTNESESGSWPTIRSTDGERGGRGDLIQAVRGNQNSHFRLWQTPVADDAVNREAGKINSRGEPKLSAQVKLWPTPTRNDAVGAGYQRANGNHFFTLPGAVGATKHLPPEMEEKRKMIWPTPNQRDYKDSGPTQGNRKSPNLGTMVHQWATPTTADAQGGPGRSDKRKGGDNLRTQAGGSLNPTWVEWLMGWPLGWTDCAHSGTDKFQQWLRSHGRR